MATAIRMIGHEERLSLVDHLEELRWRLIVSAVAFALAFGICFWQNHALLKLINGPLVAQTEQQVREGNGPLGEIWHVQQGVVGVAKGTEAIAKTLSEDSALPASTRAALGGEISRLKAQVAHIPRHPQGYVPTTLGIGEPFTTTITVALYFALLIALPVILFEVYGFIVPAFTPSERRVATPILLSVPLLFAVGAAFGYYIVLPAAVHFLQNFNSSQFNVLVQASSYYKFAVTIMIAMGLVFQVPVAILGVTQADILTPQQLRKGRRYAIIVCAAIAAFLPGDAITLALETAPLYVLYELSILLAALMVRRRNRSRRRAEAAMLAIAGTGTAGDEDGPGGQGGAGVPVGVGGPGGPDGPGGAGGFGGAGGEVDPQVREMIDHIDPDLHG